jgi:hypothetical protein
MNAFLSLLEVFLYGFSLYIILKKKEMAIFYLPVLFFVDTVIDNHPITAFAYYGVISFIIIQLISKNSSFLKNNYFALYLVVYFLLLMTRSKDLEIIRGYLFNVMWFFILLPLIPSIYKKFSREIVFRELANAAFIILAIFIANALASTYFHYNPYAMYGITSGVLFGNMYATDFNILAVAIFILLLWCLNNRNYVFLAVLVISLAFVSLSLRRSVMGISAMAAGIAAVLYLSKNPKKILLFSIAAFAIGFVVAVKTNFIATMQERIELRNLEERNINEEARYFEYRLLYDDFFRYKRYSPLIGFDLFNSPGNYGGGKFYDRSLHGDLTSIAHSSGFIGLALYLLMIFTAFNSAWKEADSKTDKLIVAFCAFTFLTFLLTGRFTQVGFMLLVFLVAKLPIAKPKEVEEPVLLEYEAPEINHRQIGENASHGMQPVLL